MRQRPSLMGTTGEFTGGCIVATIATPDVPIAAPTTTVLPRTTTVLPRTTTGGGTGPIEVAQRPHRRCRPPGLIMASFSAGGDGGRRSPEHRTQFAQVVCGSLAVYARQTWLEGTYLARIDQYTCITRNS